MSRRPKKLNAIIFLSFLGLFLGLLLIETGLRVYNWASERQFYGLNPSRTTLEWVDDTIVGRRFSPNQAGWFVPHTKEYFTYIEVGSDGWPDVERELAKPSDTYRILVLGDSFVENMQAPLEKRFFRQLESALNKQIEERPERKGVEVVAMGLGNTGTAQQFLMLKHFGLKYKPDLVIHMFLTANDVKNSSLVLQDDAYLPYFKINEKGELEKIPHKLRGERKFAKIKDFLKKFRITELLLWERQKLLERKKKRSPRVSFGLPDIPRQIRYRVPGSLGSYKKISS